MDPGVALSEEIGKVGVVKTVAEPVRTAEPVQAGSERSTRARVARLVLEHGPQTAATLSARLGLTPAAIRRHLDTLLAEGLIEARAQRVYGQRGRGRPAKVFAITDKGRGEYVQAYDDLAVAALTHLSDALGPEAVADFARAQVAALEARYGAALAAAEPERRVAVLAEALSADGYAATAGPAPGPGQAEQLCQHHCPVAHVAEKFPQLCEAETEVIGRLLGTHVQRLATIAHGDGVCTTHIPAPPTATKGSA
jgi:predicted ArsR family transcriptional regulator